MPPLLELPLELLSCIAYMVPLPDIESLALVSRRVRAGAADALQQHQKNKRSYENVSSHQRKGDKPAASEVLFRVLSEPQMAFYVRHLSFHMEPYWLSRGFKIAPGMEQKYLRLFMTATKTLRFRGYAAQSDEARWLYNHLVWQRDRMAQSNSIMVPLLISQLPYLTTLVLAGDALWGLPDMLPMLRNMATYPGALSRLKAVELRQRPYGGRARRDGMARILGFFMSIESVQKLQVADLITDDLVCLDAALPPAGTCNATEVALRSVKLANGVLKHITARLRSLQTFKYTCGQGGKQELQRIHEALDVNCRQSLRHLDVRFQARDVWDIGDWSSFPNLTSLTTDALAALPSYEDAGFPGSRKLFNLPQVVTILGERLSASLKNLRLLESPFFDRMISRRQIMSQLKSLVEVKEQVFPQLIKLDLVLRDVHDRDKEYKEHLPFMVEDLVCASKAKGIVCTVGYGETQESKH